MASAAAAIAPSTYLFAANQDGGDSSAAVRKGTSSALGIGKSEALGAGESAAGISIGDASAGGVIGSAADATEAVATGCAAGLADLRAAGRRWACQFFSSQSRQRRRPSETGNPQVSHLRNP